ncbi:MAG TPA: sigma-70 family RNA polymerase sigma factor, partial [Acidimicrobiales bacterium]|nr:sigma-70 family RNA polymerase sigma factor [Acidimicrobiales bacterium]
MAQKADELVGGPPDAELARGAADGDNHAFDELYRRHADAAWRVAYAVTGNREDAADAVAEAFTRMLAALNAGRLEDLDRFRPYLLATTRNAAIDVLRRTGRVHPTDTELADPAAAGLGPSERLLDGLDTALVASAFRSLPERWRSVLWLTEVEGMAPGEAAGLLGLSA